ncbi:YncE family protein [candidate division KSB1 bacterium]
MRVKPSLKLSHPVLLIFALLIFSGFYVVNCSDNPTDPAAQEIFQDETEILQTNQSSDLPLFYQSLTDQYENIGSSGKVYISHAGYDFVTVVDIASNEIIGIIRAVQSTVGIDFSPDGTTGYISGAEADKLFIFDKRTNQEIAKIPAGNFPTYVKVINNGAHVVISHQSSDNAWVLDTSTNTIIDTDFAGWGGICAVDGGSTLFQPQIFQGTVKIYDAVNLKLKDSFFPGGRPMWIDFTNDEQYAYLANADMNEVQKIENKRPYSIVQRISMLMPGHIDITPDGKFAYVTNNGYGTVSVIDLSNDKVISTIIVGDIPKRVIVTADGKYAYVNNLAGHLDVIDTATNTIFKTIVVASGSNFMYVDSQ